MENKTLCVAVASLNSVDNLERNIEIIKQLCLSAKKQKAEVIFFPENCLYMRIREEDKVPFLHLNSLQLLDLRKFAEEISIDINLGSIALIENGKKFNSNVTIACDGNLSVNYRKIHLFDIHLKDEEPNRESEIFNRGEYPSLINYKGWKVGFNICFDLRFTRLANYYFDNDVDLLIYPAAFLKKTGEAHWHILNRARAIEGQCFVISSAQTGKHISVFDKDKFRETYGHSLVVDPWGQVMLDFSDENQIQILKIEMKKIINVREQIPIKKLRNQFKNLDIY